MGSIRLEGVWFQVWADDHAPPHVHARYADVKLVIELPIGSGTVRLRSGSLEPANAKRADVRYALRMAQTYPAELLSLWEQLHA